MEIANKRVVRFHYTLREEGIEMESSAGKEPMLYLHGAGNIIPGLEQALDGRSAGDVFNVTVAPELAYGARNDGLLMRLPAKRLGVDRKQLSAGQMIRLHTKRGQQMARVVKVGRFMVDLDANHPLAGKTLEFEIEVVEVRDASEEELKHRHAHGPGGHEHAEV